jgi:hypothetical protein
VEPVVAKAVAAAVETPDGDAVKVALGAPLAGLEFVVKQVDAGWYLVRLPKP